MTTYLINCRTCDFEEIAKNRPFANAYRIDHRSKHPDHDVDFQEVATDGGSPIVYIVPETGSRYHEILGCPRGDVRPVPWEDAVDAGLRPCGKCANSFEVADGEVAGL